MVDHSQKHHHHHNKKKVENSQENHHRKERNTEENQDNNNTDNSNLVVHDINFNHGSNDENDSSDIKRDRYNIDEERSNEKQSILGKDSEENNNSKKEDKHRDPVVPGASEAVPILRGFKFPDLS